MFRSIRGLCFLSIVAPGIVFAQAPFPVESVARVEELEVEAVSQAEVVAKMLVDQSTFDKSQEEERVRQAFGVLAVIGQALVEHPDGKSSKVHGLGLRHAALQFKRDSTFEQSQGALEAVKKAIQGEAPAGDVAREHPWNKLIGMHGMMEEMNGRNSKILRVLRRPRGTKEEGAHASILGILSLAMHADTHEVKDPAQLPQWHDWSTEYRQAIIKMGEGIRAKDAAAARKWFDQANLTCDKCHEVFQQ